MNKRAEKTREELTEAEKIVVKVGTNSLTDDNSGLDENKVEKLVDELIELIESGKKIILVSSGAIGAGIGKLSISEVPEEMESLQAASTIGQSALMRSYSEKFERKGEHVAQLLLTQEDFTNPIRFKNLKNTIKTLLDWGVIPIINENDAVAVEEIRMGDNDLLSAFTSSGAGADLLILLTDVDGLYTDDPKRNDSAEPIRTVEKVTSDIVELTKGNSKGNFGGMRTKVQAAKIATEEGIPAVVADSSLDCVLKNIIKGEEIGTLFLPQGGKS